MASLPPLKRLRAEDFASDQRPMIEKLAFIINPFMDSIVQAFNKGLNIDNLSWEQKDMDITVDASGIPLTTAQFKSGLFNKITGIYVTRAMNQDDASIYPTGAPFVNFEEKDKVVTIQHVTGLQANAKYKLTMIAIT